MGSYTIAEAENVPIGTKIVIDLKEDCESFCDNAYVEGMIKKYSNFVGFPIKVNGQVINTIQPLWTKVQFLVIKIGDNFAFDRKRKT